MLDQFRLLIGGELVECDGSMDVLNPATEKPVAQSPLASKEQFDLAVQAAKRAYPGWAATKIGDRQKVLTAIAERIEENRDEMARLLTAEQGKPLPEAFLEVVCAETVFGLRGRLRR